MKPEETTFAPPPPPPPKPVPAPSDLEFSLFPIQGPLPEKEFQKLARGLGMRVSKFKKKPILKQI